MKSAMLLAISTGTSPVVRTLGDSQSSAVAAEKVATTTVRLNRQPIRKRCALRSEKCRPCTATIVPPRVPPRDGSRVDTVAAAWYSNEDAASDRWPPVEMESVTTPMAEGGAVHSSRPADTIRATLRSPRLKMQVASLSVPKLPPWMIRVVPPFSGPKGGYTDSTVTFSNTNGTPPRQRP